jgi:hypothetical protein
MIPLGGLFPVAICICWLEEQGSKFRWIDFLVI